MLGPLKNEENKMTQAVLTYKGTVIPHRTIRRLRVEELHSPVELEKQRLFDEVIRKKLGDASTFPTSRETDPDLVPYADDEVDTLPTINEDDPIEEDGVAQFEAPLTDLLILSEVHLPQGEEMKCAKVIQRSKNDNGEIVGAYNANPMINTLVYDVEFFDGDVREYCANVGSEGFAHTLLYHISDYKKDGNAIENCDAYVVTKRGRKRLRKFTNGWHLKVAWKDGSSQWITLKILKESNPIETAEFAIARNIQDKPAFAWWIPYVMPKRDRIISSVNSRVKKVTHKYGVAIPNSVEECHRLDKQNGNTLW